MDAAELRGWVDFGVVTIREDEFSAVLDRFPHARVVEGRHRYRIRELPLPRGGSYTIAVAGCTEQGNAEALNVARDLIADLAPAFLLVVGIAAGIPADEFTLGDVVVSKRIVDFSVEAVLQDRSRRYALAGGPLHPLAAKLSADVLAMAHGGELGNWNARDAITQDRPQVDLRPSNFYGDARWKKATRAKLASHFAGGVARSPRVVTGAIASSDRLIKDTETLDVWLKFARQIIAVEMESAGVYRATHGEQVPFLAIRGISDVVGFDRHPDWTAYACHTAASFTRAFLLTQPIPPLGTRPDPLDHMVTSGTSPLPRLAGPAALLNARYETVPFHGRDQLLRELHGWCNAEGLALVRLIHGAGGMGKTRLLIELCKRLRDERWRAGFVPKDLAPPRFAELLACERPTCAVIDYAESRPQLVELLGAVARRRAEGSRGRLRVILLSRTRGDWWDAVLRSDVADVVRDEEPIALAPIAPPGTAREAIYDAAIERFAQVRGRWPARSTRPRLDDPRYDRMLYVHMAALAAVDGYSHTARTLLNDTLDHEERFWVQQFTQRTDLDARLVIRRIRRVVAALTLRGGVGDLADAAALVARVAGAPDEAVVAFLRDLYPGDDTGDAGYICGLTPDLLGEAMVYRELSSPGKTTAATLDHVFAGADERTLRTGFELLGRISAEHPDAEQWISLMLNRDVPGRALAAFEAAMAITVDDPINERKAHTRLGIVLARTLERSGTPEIAEQLAHQLPARTVALREVAGWVTEARLGGVSVAGSKTVSEWLHASESSVGSVWLHTALGVTGTVVLAGSIVYAVRGDGWAAHVLTVIALVAIICLIVMGRALGRGVIARGGLLLRQGYWQSELGNHQAALAATQDAVRIRRMLARANRRFRPGLAAALYSLGTTQSALRQHAAALTSTQQAVTIYRQLAARQRGAFRIPLANSLHSLGSRQTELGQNQAAFASIREAIAMLRALVAGPVDACQRDLASALITFAQVQVALGQREDAVVSLQEAVAISRVLTEARPDSFLLILVKSLHRLGTLWSELGKHATALVLHREVVEIRRKLSQARPDAFQRELAGSLHDLGAAEFEAGYAEPALASMREAVAIRRTLAKADPAAVRVALAVSLNYLGRIQSARGQRQTAITLAWESVELLRLVAESDPDTVRAELASSLHNLGCWQLAAGQHEAALISCREAVAIRRALAETRPEVFRIPLANSLAALGNAQSGLGQREAARVSTQSALSLGCAPERIDIRAAQGQGRGRRRDHRRRRGRGSNGRRLVGGAATTSTKPAPRR